MSDLHGLSSRAIIGRFYHRLSELTGANWIGQLAMYFPTDQPSEEYKWLGQVPQMREWIGGRLAKSLRENGITITNKTFESTLELNVDDKRRDKTGQINIRVDELARRTNSHWAKLLSLLIDAGAATTYGNAYDGTTFFSTTHSSGDSGTWVNALTSSHVSALNISTATAPTAIEYADAILGVVAYLQQNVKDDQGELFHEDATSWLVMCPNAAQAVAAQKAIRNRQIQDANGVALENPIADSGFKLTAVFNPRLTSFNGFYIFRTDSDVKPLITQEELGVQLAAIAEGSELEFTNNVHQYGVKAIRNVGYGYPEDAAKCTFN